MQIEIALKSGFSGGGEEEEEEARKMSEKSFLFFLLLFLLIPSQDWTFTLIPLDMYSHT